MPENYPGDSIVRMDKMKPMKTPAQKRQIRIAVIVLLVVIATGVGAYFLLIPKEATYQLSDYQTATVRLITLNNIVQAGGTVVILLQLDIPNKQAGYAQGLLVKEGDTITEETILAELEFPDLEDYLFDKQIELTSAESSLRQTITSFKHSRAKLLRDIVEEEKNVEKLIRLVEVYASRQSELENARKSLAELQYSLAEQDDLHALAVENGQNTITQYKAQIERLEEDIEGA